jgi:nucleotide-binding universal stress UspA family protein
MMSVVSGLGRLVVGASGSPGSIRALRYAQDLACRNDVPLVAVLAWVPPGGDIAERRCSLCSPPPRLGGRRTGAAQGALDAAWGGVAPGLDIKPVVIRGEPGPGAGRDRELRR